MIFLSLYTKGTPYETEVWPRLRASLQDHGLESYVIEVEQRWLPDGTNDWLHACHQIPAVCLDRLNWIGGESLVWLDADATVERYPQLLFDLDAADEVDFACYHLPRAGGGPPELLDGTMYVRNTDGTRALFAEWVAEDARQPQRWEQQILQEWLPVWAERFGVRLGELPASYCRIFDHAHQTTLLEEEPVIVHWQASREYRTMRQEVGG